MKRDMVSGLLHLLYPPNCVLCKKHLSADSPLKPVCPLCEQSLQYNLPPFCPKCSRYLGKNPSSSRCYSCSKNHPHFDFAWCACLYTDYLKKLIHIFKYHQKTYLRNYFTDLMIHFINKYNLDILQFDMITPVPLSAARLRERGYNQSQMLAENLCAAYHIPLATKFLFRARDTRSQVLLSQKERWTNIAGAFRIKNSIYLKNKNILLIDDLLTTGATSSEAAKALKSGGANRVSVFTLAIAL